MSGHPFEKQIRFRLGSLFVLTTVVAGITWFASTKIGGPIVLTAAMLFACVAVPYFMFAVVSYILGTPGERQRRSEMTHVSTVSDDEVASDACDDDESISD